MTNAQRIAILALIKDLIIEQHEHLEMYVEMDRREDQLSCVAELKRLRDLHAAVHTLPCGRMM